MKSYLTFLSRNKLYTAVNVLGLSVSLMFVILMGDYTWRQYSIDTWHENADRISLMGSENMFFMWPQVADDIKQLCPEVEQTCCVLSQNGKIKSGQEEAPSVTVLKGDDENGIIMLTTPSFFQLFDFPLVEGDRKSCLDAPDKCVVSERLARSLFGDREAIGQTLQIVGTRYVFVGDEDPYDSTLVYTVSAVMRDLDHTVLPNETQLIASMERYPQVMGYKLNNNSMAYGSAGPCKVFLMTRPGMSLDSKKELIDNYLHENYNNGWGKAKLTLTPLKDIMFAPQNLGTGMQKGDASRLRILLAAVLAILFFAFSNYVNLTVANTGFRAKEMATRRLFGSSQLRITLKLMAESTLMVALCFAIGLALACYFQDAAAELFKGKIALLNDITPTTVGACLAFILLTGTVSAILPSWLIARFQPIDIVKGSFRFRSKMVLGRLFIIVQNIITVTMLTAALVIWLQIRHLINAPLGYHRENLFYVFAPDGKAQTERSLLEKMPFVEQIGTCQHSTLTDGSSNMRIIKREDKHVVLFVTDMDSTAFRLHGLEILHDYGPTNDGYYLTEEAMRQLDYGPEERETQWADDEKYPIAGVLRDFYRHNVLNGVEAFAIRLLRPEQMEYPFFLVKTNGDRQASDAFKQMLRRLGCDEDELKWYVNNLEESIADTFEEQQNTLHIISLFTLVAIVISVMGFLSLSLFFIRQRQKEIAIRKVMGSTSGEVLWLMLRTFCAPVLWSLLVAVPLAWHIMSDWLSSFSYRIALSPWIFATAGLGCLLVSVLTVLAQSWHASNENPVKNIKAE